MTKSYLIGCSFSTTREVNGDVITISEDSLTLDTVYDYDSSKDHRCEAGEE